jgi:hypothetical protein
MRQLILFTFFILGLGTVQAQNCSGTSTGFPPLNDLGMAYWHGNQGGLYPGGSNAIPQKHLNAGLAIASGILPLDTNGNIDKINGKIVWLSIGMSNTTQETQAFLSVANADSSKNPKLVLVDGAQGGMDITEMNKPGTTFWSVAFSRLRNMGLSPRQVQIVWFKQAEKGPTDTSFATYPDALKKKFITGLQLVKSHFPNTRLCYLSSRIYAGYATSSLNPEPYAWYSGWSVKRLIQDQINGDTALTFTGPNARAPWLAWGPYLWADGTTPRSDGLTWVCPDDYISDGTHPSTIGRQKVATMLHDFFTSDTTTKLWFYDQQPSGIALQSRPSEMRIVPNPCAGFTEIQSDQRIAGLRIYDLCGRQIIVHYNGNRIDCTGLRTGIYLVELTNTAGQVFRTKLVRE